MAQQRLAMRRVKDVLRLHLLGGVKSCRWIGRALGCGRTAVSQCLQRAAAAGLRIWDAVAALDEDALERKLYAAAETTVDGFGIRVAPVESSIRADGSQRTAVYQGWSVRQYCAEGRAKTRRGPTLPARTWVGRPVVRDSSPDSGDNTMDRLGMGDVCLPPRWPDQPRDIEDPSQPNVAYAGFFPAPPTVTTSACIAVTTLAPSLRCSALSSTTRQPALPSRSRLRMWRSRRRAAPRWKAAPST